MRYGVDDDGVGSVARALRGAGARVVMAGLMWLAAGAPASALTAYALTDANDLLVFETAAPGTILQEVPIVGLPPGETMAAIDFRPLDGQLYGVATSGRLYRIHMTTGRATQIGSAPFVSVPQPAQQWGIDFDAMSDRLRVIVTGAYNVELNPDTGVLLPGNPAAPFPVAIPAGANAAAFAHTGNYVGTPLTLAYGISPASDQLTRIKFQPGGHTQSPGPFLGVNIDSIQGFDIAPHADEAYMVATVGGVQRLYGVDVISGATPLLGTIGPGAAPIRSLALHSRAVLMWAVADDVIGGLPIDRVVSFLSPRPDALLTAREIEHGFASIGAIDVRPSTGELLAYGRYYNRIHRLDPTTGHLVTDGPAVPMFLGSGDRVGADFDPDTGELRLIGPSAQNLRFNPETGLTATDTPLFWSTDPVAEVAYAPPLPGHAASTAYLINLYDSSLYTLGGIAGSPPASGGTMNLVGALLFTPDSDLLGFEIPAVGHTGFLASRTGGATTLRTVNLVTGASQHVGVLPAGNNAISGLTSAPPGHVRLTSAAADISESAGTATITVERVHGMYGPISVDYAVTAGTATAGADFTLASGTLIFRDGETTKAFTVPVLQDTLDEAPETATITLSSPLLGAALVTPSSAVLTIVDDDEPPPPVPPMVTITSPTAAGTFSTTANTIAIAGTAADNVGVQSVSWSNDRGGAGTAAGTATWTVDTISLQLGVNTITVVATDTEGASATAVLVVTRDTAPPHVRTYMLAEGATGAFFQTDILLANPHASPAPVRVSYLRESGSVITQTLTLAATSHLRIPVHTVPGMDATAFSTIVESLDGLPIVVERTMAWDATRYGAHTEAAVPGPSATWYFAEGSQGFFHTYLLLANRAAQPNVATVQFLIEGRTPVTKQFDLEPSSRRTVSAGEIPELVDQSFGMIVTFAVPGVAERAMYFGDPPLFNGGHESVGATATSTHWFHAEGATGPFFDTFLLLANPGPDEATVTLRFLPATGSPVTTVKTMAGQSRLTVNIEAEHPSLANVPVATEVTSDRPLISERSMYWPGTGAWHEAHNSLGVTSTAPAWGLAEGRVGGAHHHQTYILLANPHDTAAHVTISFLRDDGTSVTKAYEVAPSSRFNVHVNTLVPELVDEEFGASITSDRPILVERAMYSDSGGVVWAAGTVAAATRLP